MIGRTVSESSTQRRHDERMTLGRILESMSVFIMRCKTHRSCLVAERASFITAGSPRDGGIAS